MTVSVEPAVRIVATHHIALVTADFARLRAFYSEVLGLPVLGGFPEHSIVFLGAGATAIELCAEDGAGGAGAAGGWAHLALEVVDVDAAYAALAARGVPFQGPPENFPPEAPAMRIAFCTDPDGNVIELLQTLRALPAE